MTTDHSSRLDAWLDFTSSWRAALRGLVFFLAALIPSKIVFFWRWDEYVELDMMYLYALNLVSRSNILSYGAWPPHDPWVGGGMDLLIHPLTRFFSPTFLSDLFFSPYASLFVTFLLHGAVGALGLYFWLRDDGLTPSMGALGAFLFANGAWFTTRLIEGHVLFAQGFYLLPWIVWSSRRVDTLRGQLILGATFAFLVLDSSVYAVLFNPFVVLSAILIDPAPWRRLIASPRRAASLATIAAGYIMLTAPRLVPLALFDSSRVVFHFQADYDPELYLLAFLYPLQHRDLAIERVHYGFHEYACYVGLLSVLIILFAARSETFRQHRAPAYAAAAFAFFAVGTGALGPLDPWLIVEHTPILSEFHIQPRLLVIFFLFFVVALAHALHALESSRVRALLCALLVVESIAVSLMTTEIGYLRYGAPRPSTTTLTSSRWDATLRGAKKPDVYLHQGSAFLRSYEPAAPPTNARHTAQEGYLGEAYPLECSGEARITRFTPGRVDVSYELSEPCPVQVNTNALEGWRVVQGDAAVVEHPDALLTFEPAAPTGDATMTYSPWYWPWVLIPSALGFALLLGFARRALRLEGAPDGPNS